MSRVALISDTHGLLRPEVVAEIGGVDAILHMGDVGSAEVFDSIARLAPLHAVRGNVDHGAWAQRLPPTACVEVFGRTIYMVHRLEDLDVDPAAAGIDLVCYGHTHVPSDDVRDGVRHVNPGSIGPRRFELPISFAFLEADGSIRFRTL
jgi:putative phosphoesterase